ncbi:MAG TPA: hypothetical protein VFW00_07735 [Rhodocyclaceae bacterium]|nr:hypothetical protein [Rhodocyclaceae bacterium]
MSNAESMPSERNDLVVEPQPQGTATSTLAQFAIRVAIVAIAITASVSWLADVLKPDGKKMRENIKKAFAARETRLRVNGMLSSNPRVNFELSVLFEQRGDLQAALDEMIVAVGILEKVSAPAETMAPYRKRLDALTTKMQAARAQSAPAHS